MSKKIIRHELVSVVIPAGSTATRFNIPDLPNLRNVLTFGLEVYTLESVAKDIISSYPVLPHSAVVHNSYITMVNYGGKEFLKQAPSIMFNTVNNNANASTNWSDQDFKSLVGQRINYPKSFIEFTTAPAVNGYDQAFIFSVFYSLPILEEQKESGYSFSNKG